LVFGAHKRHESPLATLFAPKKAAFSETANITFAWQANYLYIYVVAPTEFRWIEWNAVHATEHGCLIAEIESVVRNAGRGFPRKRDREKWLVMGRGVGGRMIRVIYVLDADGTAFVIHAMPLTRR